MNVSSLARVRTLVVVARGGVRGGEEVGEAVDGVLGGGEGDGIRARGARLSEGGRGASPRRGGEPNGVGQERRAVALEKSDVDVETRHARAPERHEPLEQVARPAGELVFGDGGLVGGDALLHVAGVAERHEDHEASMLDVHQAGHGR